MRGNSGKAIQLALGRMGATQRLGWYVTSHQMEFWVVGDAGLSSVGILILESHNFWLTVSPWSAQFSKSSYWWLSFISLFWTSSFLIFVTHLVHDGSSGFVLSQDFPLTVAICFAPLILHGSNLQEKIYNRLRASWGLLLRLQLQSNQLEGKRESSSYTTQGFPSSWGNWFPLGQKDEFVVEDNILKVLLGSVPHHAEWNTVLACLLSPGIFHMSESILSVSQTDWGVRMPI